MSDNKKILKLLTGEDKDRFIREMGKERYKNLVQHLKKLIQLEKLNGK